MASGLAIETQCLLCTRLRESNIDAAAGSVEGLTRIAAQIRARWPQVEIIISW